LMTGVQVRGHPQNMLIMNTLLGNLMHRTACRSGHAVGRRPRLSPDKRTYRKLGTIIESCHLAATVSICFC
jgi:hypothetical protein